LTGSLLFLPHLRKAEGGIAAKIRRLATAARVYPSIDFEKAVAWCEQRTGNTLAPSQREALKTVLTGRAAFITGGPGVSKTTLVNSILMILRAKGVKCLLPVHDELVFEVPETEIDEVRRIVVETMTQAADTVLGGMVPVEVEPVVGETWGKA
jgi:hypothetical protein